MSTSILPPDASECFAQAIASTRYVDLSDRAVEIVKKSIIDTVGVSLAATTLNPDAARVGAITAGFLSPTGSRILGFGTRAPAPLAAWANGALAHALDFDDIGYEAFAHPSAAVVPAVFALAEHLGAVPGEELITAVALGQDMVVRLCESLDWKTVSALPWLPFPVMGTFAAAGACARLLRLDRTQAQSAIAGALAYAAGAGELQYGGLRGLYDAWAAQGGVLAALVARQGVQAPSHPLEGERGLFAQYWMGQYDRHRLLDGLGRTFRGERCGYKAWPSCAVTHPALDAALRIARTHAIETEEVESVTVRVSAAARPQCTPIGEKRRPATVMDAKFSFPFTVAVALCTGNVRLKDFTSERIRDPKILALAQRVTTVEDMALQGNRGIDPCVVEVRLKSGATHVVGTEKFYGHEDNPMSMEDIVAKFMDCASYAISPPGEDRCESFVDGVKRLQESRDSGYLFGLIEPGPSALRGA